MAVQDARKGEAEASRADRLRVFLSYSRKDAEFTERLAARLAENGYQPDFDQSQFDPANIESGISAEDEWWLRLQQMIAGADVMIFIVSPDSAASPVCDEEIAYARSLGKRIIPILRREIDFKKAPPRLAALNVKIGFAGDADSDFEASLKALCEALEIDVEWYREAKRLTGLAARWDRQGRPDDLLLTHADVRAIGDLLERRPSSAPEISTILVQLRDESRTRHENEARVRRRLQSASIVLLSGIVFGLVAWINQDFIKDSWHWFAVDRPYIVQFFRPHVLTAEKERTLRQGATFKECSTRCPEMVVIPGGDFTMGAENGREYERPVHRVSIARFAVAKYEVTQDEWAECVSLDACDPLQGEGGDGRQPVIRVTWTMAQEYLKWLRKFTGKEYRLLSESEWEYAARAGSDADYSFGDDPNTLCDYGNLLDKAWRQANPASESTIIDCDDGYAKPAPVGAYKPNAFGLYDVHGNLWEWVEDCWHDDYTGAPDNGSAWTSGECEYRVTRGGSWDNNARAARSANRYRGLPGAWAITLGFRVARNLPPDGP